MAWSVLRSTVPDVEEGLLESLAALSRLLEPPADGYERLALLAHQVVSGCDHGKVAPSTRWGWACSSKKLIVATDPGLPNTSKSTRLGS